MGRPKKAEAKPVVDQEPINNGNIETTTDQNPDVELNFPDDLKATLEKYPHIHCVWMNEAGVWHFAEKAGFVAIAREQILNG